MDIVSFGSASHLLDANFAPLEWPDWWNALFGFAGAAILLAWALGFPRSRADERRRAVQRRR